MSADGQFKTSRTGDQGEIDAGFAEALAKVWIKTYGPITTRWLEETHGGPIDFKNLAPCKRTLYARRAFEPLPADIPAPTRRPWGSWWLVTLCDGNIPEVSLAVAAETTELRIEKGHIVFPFASGNEFFPIGIPLGRVGEYPMPPEEAVTNAANTHHRLVTNVPELVMPIHTDGPPQGARWKIELDSSVNAKTSRRETTSTRVFTGHGPNFSRLTESIPADSQPETVGISVLPAAIVGETQANFQSRLRSRMREVRVRRRQDTPLAFDALLPGGSN